MATIQELVARLDKATSADELKSIMVEMQTVYAATKAAELKAAYDVDVRQMASAIGEDVQMTVAQALLATGKYNYCVISIDTESQDGRTVLKSINVDLARSCGEIGVTKTPTGDILPRLPVVEGKRIAVKTTILQYGNDDDQAAYKALEGADKNVAYKGREKILRQMLRGGRLTTDQIIYRDAA